MERPEHITYTRDEAMDLLVLLDEAAEALTATDALGLVVQLEDHRNVLAFRLFPDLPEATEDD